MRLARVLLAAGLATCAGPQRSGPAGESSPAERILGAFSAGDFERAEQILSAASEEEESADLLLARSRLLASRGETESALAPLERALVAGRFSPQEARRFHLAIARIAFDADDFERAAAHARAAGATDGSDPMLAAVAAFGGRAYDVRSAASGPVPLRVEPLAEVPVRLNDSVESIFVLDSGASLTVVTRTLAERAGVEILSGAETAVDPSGKRIDAAVGRLASLEIGKARIEEVPVLVVDDERLAFRLLGLFTVFRAQGAIGLGVLKNFRTTLDLEAAALELEPASEEDDGGVPLRSVDGALFVSASAAGHAPRAFLLDTGADRCSLSDLGAEALEGVVTIVASLGRGASAGGTTVFLRRAQDVDLVVGGVRAGRYDLPVWGTGREGEVARFGTIGLDLLRRHRVILEAGGTSLRLEPKRPGP